MSSSTTLSSVSFISLRESFTMLTISRAFQAAFTRASELAEQRAAAVERALAQALTSSRFDPSTYDRA